MNSAQKAQLLREIDNLHQMHESAGDSMPDSFEPDTMRFLKEETDAYFEDGTGKIFMSFEVQGTRYEGRTENIERIKLGDTVRIIRDEHNSFNHNNFAFHDDKGYDLGNMPAALCNAMAPLYDEGVLKIEGAVVSYVEPILQRSRYAKKAILFVKLEARLAQNAMK